VIVRSAAKKGSNVRVERLVQIAAVCALLAGCSGGDSGSHAEGLDGAGGDGSGGAPPRGDGGRAGSVAGAPSAGGAAFDAAAVLACGIDAGADECRSCLAAKCCDAAQACFGDPTCGEAFGPYQACVVEHPDDTSSCFSTFARAIVGESRLHEPLVLCIATGGCGLCGPPAVL
jgi:hypothetical protein